MLLYVTHVDLLIRYTHLVPFPAWCKGPSVDMAHSVLMGGLVAISVLAVLSSATDADDTAFERQDCVLEYDKTNKKVWGCLALFAGNDMLQQEEIGALGALGVYDSREAWWTSDDEKGLTILWSEGNDMVVEANAKLLTNRNDGYSALVIVPEGTVPGYSVTSYCMEFVVHGTKMYNRGNVKGIENHPGCPWNGPGFVDRYLRLAEYISKRLGFLMMSLQDSASFVCRAKCVKSIRTYASLFEIFKSMLVVDQNKRVLTFYEKHGGFKFGILTKTPVGFERSKVMLHEVSVGEFLNVARERLAGATVLKLEKYVADGQRLVGEEAFGDDARLGEAMVALWTGKLEDTDAKNSDKCEACKLYNDILAIMISEGDSFKKSTSGDRPPSWIEAMFSYLTIWQSGGDLTKSVTLSTGNCAEEDPLS